MKWRLWMALGLGVLAVGLWLSWSEWATASLVHGPTLLSDLGEPCSAVEPRLATSGDGQWIAAAWVQSTQSQSGVCKEGLGRAVLRWATEGSAFNGWRSPLTVFDGSAQDDCVVHVDLALHQTTAHVVATVWSPCLSPQTTLVRYKTCNLEQGFCDAWPQVVTSTTTGRMLDARLALDAGGNPYVIYNVGQDDASGGEVYFARKSGSSWTTVAELSKGNVACEVNAYRPGIAWTQASAGSRLVFVWENRSTQALCYRFCPANDACTTQTFNFAPFEGPISNKKVSPLPAVAAKDDRVVLVRQVCVDDQPGTDCTQFDLLYARSDNGGSSFEAELEVGTNDSLNSMRNVYRGTANEQVASYAAHLRPALVMDADGYPHLAWQVKPEGGGHQITMTHVISLDTDLGQSFVWQVRHDEWQGQGDDWRLLPAIRPAAEPGGMHQVFMLKAAPDQPYRIYYDYFGTRRVAQVLLQPLTTTALLPEQRALPVVARVLDQGGRPVAGSAVTFGIRNPDPNSLDSASFNFSGVDDSPITLFTDAEGWITTTIYANKPVTVNVTAWLDFNGDVELNGVEPSAVVSRIWLKDPDYTGGYILVDNYAPFAGDPLEVSVQEHEYSAEGYSLWWCPVTGTVKASLFYTDTVGVTPVNFEVEVRTPWQVNGGAYRIESHSGTGEPDGCADTTTRVAYSSLIRPGFRAYLPLVLRKK